MSRARLVLLAALTAGTAAAAAAQESAAPVAEAADAPSADPWSEDWGAHWGRGPMEVRDPYLLALSRYAPWARSPRTLRHLEAEVGLRSVWSNSYGFARNRFFVDGEVRRFVFAARVGLFDRLELGLLLPVEWRGGGVMDGFIEDFHEVFGLPDDRNQRPQDRFGVAGVEADGSPYAPDLEHDGFSDLVTEARVLLHAGSAYLPATALTLRLRLPTGRRALGLSDAADVSLALDLSHRLGDTPFWGYMGGAYTYYGRAITDGLEQTRHRGFFYLGVEAELTSWLSVVAHGWIESRRETQLFRDPASTNPLTFPEALEYGNYVTYVALGFKAEPVEGLLLEVGALENIIDPENTADFTVLFNISYTFGGEAEPAGEDALKADPPPGR